VGDVRHSKASIEKFQMFNAYEPKIKFGEGLEKVYSWYEAQ
jgi:nucleoside-diphosphate-sugar epimerase